MRWKYGKLLTNLGNAVEAVFGAGRPRTAAAGCARAPAEGKAVLDAAGIAYASPRGAGSAARRQVQVEPVTGPGAAAGRPGRA